MRHNSDRGRREEDRHAAWNARGARARARSGANALERVPQRELRAAQSHPLGLVHRERPRESQRELDASHSSRRSLADKVFDWNDLDDGAGVPADDDPGAAAGCALVAVVADVRLDDAARAVYEAVTVHVTEQKDLRADLEAQRELHFLLRVAAEALDALLFRESYIPVAAAMGDHVTIKMGGGASQMVRRIRTKCNGTFDHAPAVAVAVVVEVQGETKEIQSVEKRQRDVRSRRALEEETGGKDEGAALGRAGRESTTGREIATHESRAVKITAGFATLRNCAAFSASTLRFVQ